LRELGDGRGETDFQSFDFAEPSLLAGFGYAGVQVVADAGQPGALGGVGAQQRAAKAGLTEMILSWDASRPRRWV
jgi:hypothetical protein